MKFSFWSNPQLANGSHLKTVAQKTTEFLFRDDHAQQIFRSSPILCHMHVIRVKRLKLGTLLIIIVPTFRSCISFVLKSNLRAYFYHRARNVWHMVAMTRLGPRQQTYKLKNCYFAYLFTNNNIFFPLGSALHQVHFWYCFTFHYALFSWANADVVL